MNIPVYLETGSRRTFASALNWPGWSRSGKDETLAIEALLNYGLRYAAVARVARLPFQAPANVLDFVIVQRLEGDTTTDMGTPGGIPPTDVQPMDDAEVLRLQGLLKACWVIFDQAVDASRGKTLRAGPRGGGRDRQKIIEHVLGGEHAYISRLGMKLKLSEEAPLDQSMQECRQAIQEGLAASAHGEFPSHGPRGALHWPARYFARRSAWHILDHAWEIQDRLT
jgi:hypothetical protein